MSLIGIANPASTSTNFQTLGNRVYAYTGAITGSSSTIVSIFKDRTPLDASYLLKCYIDIADATSYTLFIDLNGIEVGKFFINGDEAYPSTSPFELIVPADTEVQLRVFDTTGTPNHYCRIIGNMIDG